MLTEADIAGVYVAPITIYGVAALVPFLALRWMFGRLGVLRAVWHPALFELSLYLAIVSALVLFA